MNVKGLSHSQFKELLAGFLRVFPFSGARRSPSETALTVLHSSVQTWPAPHLASAHQILTLGFSNLARGSCPGPVGCSCLTPELAPPTAAGDGPSSRLCFDLMHFF